MTKAAFSISPVPFSIHECQTQLMINKLKPVSNDLKNKWHESAGSVSELSLSVNDSATGASFHEIYDSKEVLGEGGFAMVYRCVHKQRRQSYAVKEIFTQDYDVSGCDRTQLILEYMKGGDLLERVTERKFFSEAEGRRISRRLLEAIYFCHKKQVAHRDIKPENILLADHADDTKVKLGDFGCAHRITGSNCLRTLCGSPQYVAPELYMHEDGYDERCDLWSAGVVIYVILGGYAPFDTPTAELPEAICEGFFEFHDDHWGEIPKEAKDVIKSLLVVNPDDRATLDDTLDSQWLRRRDKESIMRYTANMDGSSTNTFDAWVRLQNESNHSNSWNSGDDSIGFDDSYKAPNSARSLQVEKL